MERGKDEVDISIVVCCYNGNSTINSCLESLLNQKRSNIYIEIVLVDDGSIDGTAIKIKTFLEEKSELEKIEFNYFRKENQGLSIARNFGLEKSKSKIVAYVDEDAIVDENFSNSIIEVFNKYEDINCIGGEVLLLNSTNSFAKLIQNSIFSLHMKSNNAVIGTNMAFRKKTIKNVGGFQPEFTYRGDESALFVKGKNIINIFKSKNTIVSHPQPSSLKDWLKTRYENGFFGAAIDDLAGKTNYLKNKRLLIGFLHLFWPVLVLVFLIFFKIGLITIFATIIYMYLIIKRFFYSNSIPNYLREYNLNTSKSMLSQYLLIILICILGSLFEDYGYLKGYLKYKNTDWHSSIY